MPILPGEPIEGNTRLESLGLAAYPSSTGEVLKATAEEAWATNPTVSALQLMRVRARKSGPEGIGAEFGEEALGPSVIREQVLSPDEANLAYGIKGHLTFADPVEESTARDFSEEKQKELRRRDVFARSQGGAGTMLAQLGVGLGVSILDPLNVASAFIPFVGPTRYALALERAGASGSARSGVRARIGAVEGAAGATLVEPIVLAATSQRQADYDALDSLLNVAFGTVIGGGLHTGLGALGDAIRARRLEEPTLREAVAAVVEDRPVRVDTSLREAMAPEPTARTAEVRIAAEQPISEAVRVAPAGRRSEIVTPDDKFKVEVEDIVVEAQDLIRADDPRVTGNLQPRDRAGRKISDVQISDIAAKLDPQRLGASRMASDGAPVVGPDGIVESGNGRVMAILQAYRQHPESAARYREFLRAQGHDIEGMVEPILVRRRLTALTDTDRESFVLSANERDTMALSATERALSDARSMTDATLEKYRGGEATMAQNRDFARRFMDDAVSKTDQAAMVGPDGSLSQSGVRRIEAAILAKAYDDANTIQRLIEATDSNIKTIGGALIDAAPAWVKMRAAAKAGTIPADLDITRNVLEAAKAIGRARDEGLWIGDAIKQTDMFGGGIDPVTETLIRAFYRDDALKRAMGREPIGDILRFYADEAAKATSGPKLFADMAEPRSTEILSLAQERFGGRSVGQGQGDFFARGREQQEGATGSIRSDASRGAEAQPASAGRAGTLAQEHSAELTGALSPAERQTVSSTDAIAGRATLADPASQIEAVKADIAELDGLLKNIGEAEAAEIKQVGELIDLAEARAKAAEAAAKCQILRGAE